MKMVGYRCKKCGKSHEDLFSDSEKKPETHPTMKCECGGRLKKWDVKGNTHRAFVSDSRRA